MSYVCGDIGSGQKEKDHRKEEVLLQKDSSNIGRPIGIVAAAVVAVADI